VEAVAAAFGRGVLAADGGVDRIELGTTIFREPELRARLNGLMHPLVRAEEERRARQASLATPVLVVDGALIIENGGHLRFDRLVVVHCPPEVQIARLRHRDGLDGAAARRRVEAQMPVMEKRRFANDEVDTNGPAEVTDRQVDALAPRLRRLAAQRGGPGGVPSPGRVLGCLTYGPRMVGSGLSVSSVLRHIVESGKVELADVAAWIEPAHVGGWYELAGREEGGGRAEVMGIVAALLELGRSRPDVVHAVSAGVSLARLRHRRPSDIAGACLMAETLFTVGRASRVPIRWREELGAWRAAARRWGEAEPAADVVAALDAAARFPGDLPSARAVLDRGDAAGELLGALGGLGGGLLAGDQGSAEDAETARLVCGRR
jgi:dephospho-CoA kinase